MAYAKKKKTKKAKDTARQLEAQSEVESAVDKAIHVVVAQWKPILIVLGGTGLVLGAISVFQYAHAQKEDKAAALLYDAELELPDPSGYGFSPFLGLDEGDQTEQLQGAVDEFQKVIDEYDGTIHADIANMEAGHALMQANDHAAAAERYATAAGSKSDLVQVLALNGQGTALESAEDFEQATTVFKELTNVATGPLKEYAYLDLIRVQELAGDDEGALASCREFEEKLPESPKLKDVQARIRALGAEPADIEIPEEETADGSVAP